MDTTHIRVAFGAILILLLFCHPYLSKAEDAIYLPVDLFSINCGSTNNFSARDGRNWTGDTPSARLSRSPFSYSFPVTQGPKFLRLFFYSSSYHNFDRSKAYFSVKSGPYTLLQRFNASLNADDDAGDILFREYCINVEDGERLNITFIPSTTDSYAFINGIEIVSIPPYLYYTDPHIDNADLPQLVGQTTPFPIENNHALETMYRLTVAGREIPPSEDTGMLRSWDGGEKYLTSQSGPSVDIAADIKLSFTNITPYYTAPDQVYRTLRNMGPVASMNMRFNLTWQLPIDSGFFYLLRLHFCQLDPQKGVPVDRDYVVLIPGNQAKPNLSLKMHPHPKSLTKDAQLNAIELFKISDSTGSLAGPNPDAPPQTQQVPRQISNKKSSGSTKTLVAAVAGAVSCVLLLSFIVAFFLVKCKKNVVVDNKKDGTSRGDGSS
uniref:Receptor-like protein kinase FERONIA n=1 Tax=Cajanus cajan TaxID=3821 RepID=A0A151QQC2_CAJCA|nr:Receptor-like protein kinase FERONIA [Cajanus cajan]